MRDKIQMCISRDFGSLFVSCLIAIKPISDMFWQTTMLDTVLVALGVITLVYGVTSRELRLYSMDILIVSFLSLLTLSLFANTAGVNIYIKMASSIMMFYLGRLYWDDYDSIITSLKSSLLFIILINSIMLLTGRGFRIWGNTNTFTGMYFFKTDLANAAFLSMVVFLYYGKNRRLSNSIILLSLVMIIVSDTRSYYIITLIAAAIYVCYRMRVKISGRLVLVTAVGLIAALFLLNWMFALPLFRENNYLGIHFEQISDLFNASNTQGRNSIWESLIQTMRDAGLAKRLFGIDLVGDTVVLNGVSYDSHSLYIGLLYNVGLVGLLSFLLFILLCYRSISKLEYSLDGYFTFTLLFAFIVSGITVYVLQYTANAWIPFFELGHAVARSSYRSDKNPSVSMHSFELPMKSFGVIQ